MTLKRRPGGGSHQAWDVIAGGEAKWFLRADAVEPDDGKHYTLRREAEIYRAVNTIGLPSPTVLGIHPELEAVLLERSSGDAAFARLDPAAQTEIIDDFAPWLARLHAADPATLDLAGADPRCDDRRSGRARTRPVGVAARLVGRARPAPHGLLPVAPRQRPRHRRPAALAGAGRHRPGQLPPRRAPRHRVPRLRARPPRRPDGGPRLGRHPQRPGAGARLRALPRPLHRGRRHRARSRPHPLPRAARRTAHRRARRRADRQGGRPRGRARQPPHLRSAPPAPHRRGAGGGDGRRAPGDRAPHAGATPTTRATSTPRSTRCSTASVPRSTTRGRHAC